MTLTLLAKKNPKASVRLHFRDERGQTGTLLTTAEHALCPNRSQRFFPPDEMTPTALGWPVPYWYASECYRVEVISA